MYIASRITKYAHKRGVTVCVKYREDINSTYNTSYNTLYFDKEIADFFGISTKAYRKKLREYGAEEIAIPGFMKKLYFTNIDNANKFMNEYLEPLILLYKLR